MNSRTKNLLLAFGLFAVVIGFGALDDWFGDNLYGADGIAYADNAKAILHGDWSMALNPYWSFGYPLALALVRPLFSPDWAGDWTSIRVVDLLVFIGSYASFLFFLRQAVAYAASIGGAQEAPQTSPALVAVGSLIFLQWELALTLVSRITPDLMVSGFFFLLTALSLRFCARPAIGTALLMGVVAALGYIAKAAFLPVSFFIFLVVFARIATRPRADRFPAVWKLAWVVPAMAMVALPYVIALSSVVGRFTLGESGSLNYAWTVNHLTHWHWTGGPPEFGTPLHGVRLLSTSPHVYEYAEPLHVTYPPFYNPFYWYDGYHHFFHLRNQLAAIYPNVFTLIVLFFDTPHAPVKFVVAIVFLIAAAFVLTQRRHFAQRLLALWPVYVPALMGIGMYLMVTMDGRYIVGFIVVALIAPLIALTTPTPLANKRIIGVIFVLIGLLCVKNLLHDTRIARARAVHNEPYISKAEDWRIGFYLAQTGVAPGTKVAMVKVEVGIQTMWAYTAGLHVVGQIGNQDFDERQQKEDFHLFIDDADVQQTVFDLWRKSGAELVVALGVPGQPQGEGWTQIPTTDAWVHRL
jgi:hypothetical protein